MLDFVLFRLESEYKANESRVKLEQEKDEEREELGARELLIPCHALCSQLVNVYSLMR